MKTIAGRLKHCRMERGWTQAELVINAGVSTGTIGIIESGARQSKGSLQLIAQALAINERWLTTGEGSMPSDRQPQTANKFSYLAEDLSSQLDGIKDEQRKRVLYAQCVLLLCNQEPLPNWSGINDRFATQ